MAPLLRAMSWPPSNGSSTTGTSATSGWLISHSPRRFPTAISRTPLTPPSNRHGSMASSLSCPRAGTDAYAVDHAPANDPYVITVGGFDDRGTTAVADDSLASWSSRGVTVDGYGKPDLVAPGVAVTSTLAKGSSFAHEHGSSVVDKHYITLDGTSRLPRRSSPVRRLFSFPTSPGSRRTR
jgi:hypothetical protein